MLVIRVSGVADARYKLMENLSLFFLCTESGKRR